MSKPKGKPRGRSGGRNPKSEEARVQKSANLTPRVWAFIAMMQIGHPGDSESDALERIIRAHPLFVPESKE